jgi:hypothetical protein
MKLILENWKKYLKEYEDDDEDLPLGKYVWPKDAIDPDPEKEKEINTALEEMLQKKIKAHIDNALLSSESVEIIKELIDKNLYPEVFKRYAVGEVYRGMYVSPGWMRETFTNFEESRDESGSIVEADFSVAISPLEGRDVASWTRDLDLALEFSQSPSKDHRSGISLVLVADAAHEENYFIDLEPIYDTYKFAKHMAFEEEVVGVGDIKIKKVMWTEQPRLQR